MAFSVLAVLGLHGFLHLWQLGATLRGGAPPSRCGPQALGVWASYSWHLGMWNLPRPKVEAVSCPHPPRPALAGGFLTPDQRVVFLRRHALSKVCTP